MWRELSLCLGPVVYRPIVFLLTNCNRRLVAFLVPHQPKSLLSLYAASVGEQAQLQQLSAFLTFLGG